MEQYGQVKVVLVVCFKDINGKSKCRDILLYTDRCTLAQAKGYYLDVRGMQAEVDRAAVHYSWTHYG